MQLSQNTTGRGRDQSIGARLRGRASAITGADAHLIKSTGWQPFAPAV